MPRYELKGKTYNIPPEKDGWFQDKYGKEAKLLGDNGQGQALPIQVDVPGVSSVLRTDAQESMTPALDALAPKMYYAPYAENTESGKEYQKNRAAQWTPEYIQEMIREDPTGQKAAQKAGQIYPDSSSTYNAAQRQTGFWKTGLGDTLEKLGAGFTGLAGGFAKIPEKLREDQMYAIAKIVGMSDEEASKFKKIQIPEISPTGKISPVTDKPASDYYFENRDKLSERGARYGNIIDPETGQIRRKTYSDLWKEGDYLGAAGDIFLTGAESAPTTAVAMIPGAGLPLIAVSAAGQKLDQLDKENPDMPEWKKLLDASVTGALEGITERLGAKVDVKMIAPFLEKMTEKTVKQILAKGGINALIQTVTEGGEEVLSQLGENAIDAATGVTDTYKPFEGVQDSFVYGAGGGAQFGGLTLGASGLRAGQTARENRAVRREREMSDLTQRVSRDVDSNLNESTGTLMSANIGGKEAQVMKGNIVQQEDGTIDYDRSDKEIYYVNPETGKKEVTTIQNVESVIDNIGREEAISRTVMPIIEQENQTEADLQTLDEKGFKDGEEVFEDPFGNGIASKVTITGFDGAGKVVIEDDEGITRMVSPSTLKRPGEIVPVDNGSRVRYRDPKDGSIREGVVNDLSQLSAGVVAVDNTVVPVTEVLPIDNGQLTIDNGGNTGERGHG